MAKARREAYDHFLEPLSSSPSSNGINISKSTKQDADSDSDRLLRTAADFVAVREGLTYPDMCSPTRMSFTHSLTDSAPPLLCCVQMWSKGLEAYEKKELAQTMAALKQELKASVGSGASSSTTNAFLERAVKGRRCHVRAATSKVCADAANGLGEWQV
jgi:hypothetical protein